MLQCFQSRWSVSLCGATFPASLRDVRLAGSFTGPLTGFRQARYSGRALGQKTAILRAQRRLSCLKGSYKQMQQTQYRRECKRTFSLSTIPAPILIPLTFTGLLITLWAYKCLMMVLFQNKIIYMPSMPPFARSEKLEDYAIQCKPVTWREERIEANDGVGLALAIGNIEGAKEGRDIVILYFQG